MSPAVIYIYCEVNFFLELKILYESRSFEYRIFV